MWTLSYPPKTVIFVHISSFNRRNANTATDMRKHTLTHIHRHYGSVITTNTFTITTSPLLPLLQIRLHHVVHDQPQPSGCLRLYLGIPAHLRHHCLWEMLLHPAAPTLPDCAEDLHHRRHHRGGGGVVQPGGITVPTGMCLWPLDTWLDLDAGVWRLLPQAPGAHRLSGRGGVRDGLSVGGYRYSDYNNDNNDCEVEAGGGVAGRDVVRWWIVSPRDRPHQDAHLQFCFLHHLRLSHHSIQVRCFQHYWKISINWTSTY